MTESAKAGDAEELKEWASKDFSIFINYLRDRTHFDADLIERMLAFAVQVKQDSLPVQSALSDQGMDCTHYQKMLTLETGATRWEQVSSHIEPAAQPGQPALVRFGTQEQRMAMLKNSLPQYDTRLFSNLSNQAHGYVQPSQPKETK